MSNEPSTGGTNRRQITRDRRVVCEHCNEFEMGKSYSGASATAGEREYVDIDLPDECPICGEDTTVETGGRR